MRKAVMRQGAVMASLTLCATLYIHTAHAFSMPALAVRRPLPMAKSVQRLHTSRQRLGVLPLKAMVDPASVHAATTLLDPAHLAAISPETMTAINGLPDVQGVMQLLADAAAAVDASAAGDVAADKPGIFGSFVNVIVFALTSVHNGLKGVGIPGAWGLSIALFTAGIKTLTYPLNYKQMSSTMALQAIQPKMKAIQNRYANDPQKMNEMIAQLYQEENVNPLAGCLPTLVQIPVFIGLYRSVLQLAQKDLLEESFLWIPSLQGPVGEYNLKTGLPIDPTAWLFKGWVDGHPALGWQATAAYLSLPVILVITQTISQKILQPPPSDDPAQQQTQQILKFLPLMIGYFALNVPAGLGVYWVFNNVITTTQVWGLGV
jgi:YidC/Oxa1 family membrane protein insertase